MTLLPDVARRLAISRAASKRRSSKKPLFVRIDSPMSSALRASPCARTIIDCRKRCQYPYTGPGAPTYLFFLNCLVDQEGCPKCGLLRNLQEISNNIGRDNRVTNLFSLDCMSKFRGEGYVSDGNIIEDKVEPQSPLGQILADKARHLHVIKLRISKRRYSDIHVHAG